MSTLIEKCDKFASLIARIKQPRCSVCFKPGTLHKETDLCIKGIGVHHLLSKSVYLHLRYEPMNLLVLCPKHHTGLYLNHRTDREPFHAHESAEEDPESRLPIPNKFEIWLQSQENNRWCWMKTHEHKKNRPLETPLEDILVKLKKEYEEILKIGWIDIESPQVDPRLYPNG